MARTILEQAKIYLRQKKYSHVTELLEPNMQQYYDNFNYHYYLGLASLHSGDIGGASTFFNRARKIKMREPDLLVAQAVLLLRRGETNLAIEYYLEALEYDENHKLAKKSLNFLRKKGDLDTIFSLVESNKIKKFYPDLGKSKTIFLIIPLIALFFFIGYGSFIGIKNKIDSSYNRADLSNLALITGEQLATTEGGTTYRYILTEKQIQNSFDNAKKLFHKYNDNAAQVEVNRILQSNASSSVKQKAQLLINYLEKPGFDSNVDFYSYNEVIKEPFLYQDCWVRWKGMATNVEETESYVKFDFLVGYDMRTKLEGIVPVVFDNYISFEISKPIEILAKITIKNNSILLEADSFFQSIRTNN